MPKSAAGKQRTKAGGKKFNGGTLLPGGKPGNKGGIGRPPSAIREHLRGSFAERVKVLESIADGEPIVRVRLPDGSESESRISASPADRIRAIDMLAKYGLGTQVEVPVDKDGEEVEAQVIIIGGRTVRF